MLGYVVSKSFESEWYNIVDTFQTSAISVRNDHKLKLLAQAFDFSRTF